MIGLAIEQLREAKGWEQVELARAANLSEAAISRYEGGKRTPKGKFLRAVADALGTTPAELRELGERMAEQQAIEKRKNAVARRGDIVVTSKGHLHDWMDAVGGSRLDGELTGLLMTAGVRTSQDNWIIAKTPEFAASAKLDYDLLDRRWGDLLATPFVAPYAGMTTALRMVIPSPD